MPSEDSCSERLSRHQRLRRTRDFQDTYNQGRRWVGPNMVLWLRSGENACLRLGVVASRKVGGAVQRAKAKRKLREAFRRNRKYMQGEVDVVLVARRGILMTPFSNVNEEMMTLAKQAGIVSTQSTHE